VLRLSGNSGLFVVVMLLQTLLSELQLPSVVDDNFLRIIMSCCHILVTSSTFGLSLTTKFDHMVGSSAGLCLPHHTVIISSHFYRASTLLAMQSAVLARGILSVRLSVCPLCSGIVSRRMKIRSCGFQHLEGQSL